MERAFWLRLARASASGTRQSVGRLHLQLGAFSLGRQSPFVKLQTAIQLTTREGRSLRSEDHGGDSNLGKNQVKTILPTNLLLLHSP